MFLSRLAGLFLVSLALTGCTVIDIRNDEGRSGVESSGLIHGYATWGWSDTNSIARLEVLDGNSPGSILLVELWKIARVEIGLLGLSAGVGPANAGVGVLFYKPQPPFAVRDWDDDECEDCDSGESCEDCESDEHCEECDELEEDDVIEVRRVRVQTTSAATLDSRLPAPQLPAAML